MPLVENSSYPAWPLCQNGHLQTILPSLFRRVGGISYQRERLELPDGDFLDLDWVTHGSPRVVVISHGLEGDSRRPYVLGMARALVRRGWDVLAWNARGCSGEPNRLLRFTHSGATEDLAAVIRHAAAGSYRAVALVGFSLGGNLTLKYLGEGRADLPDRLVGAVALSTPCDLMAGSVQLSLPGNRIYMRRFLRCLRRKIRAKMVQFPGEVDDSGYEQMTTFADFDGRYTAPIHGFSSAEDYWIRSSSRPFLGRIGIPTLLINARNDPFLAPECFPEEEARQNGSFFLEIPRAGGHNGFMSLGAEYWAERRTAEFLQRYLNSGKPMV